MWVFEKDKGQTFSKYDEKYKLADPRNSVNFNQDKHKENYTKTHRI